MTKTNHSKEPWTVATNTKSQDITIYGLDAKGMFDQWICDIQYQGMGKANLANYQANARRIVACVNACAGISNETLEDIENAGIVGNDIIYELQKRFKENLKKDLGEKP